MLASLCRFAALVAVLATTTRAAAQVPGYDFTEPDEVVPAIAVEGWGIIDPIAPGLGYATEGDLPWHPRHGVLRIGAILLTSGYALGIALGMLDLEVDPGSSCDDTIGGLHAVPVFGPIAGWVMLGTCRTQIEPVLQGLMELPPAALQLAGFILVLVGAAGVHGGVAVPRITPTRAGVGLAVDF